MADQSIYLSDLLHPLCSANNTVHYHCPTHTTYYMTVFKVQQMIYCTIFALPA